jgi:hypothetical protein
MSGVWSSELIPDDALLYQFVHQQWFSKKTGGVSPTFFKNVFDPRTNRAGMSTDWSRYSTPEETRDRAKDPTINGVIESTASDVRAIPEQIVEHTPIQNHPDPEVRDNQAHTDVFGPKDDLEIKRWFSRICRIVIDAPPRNGAAPAVPN